VQELGQPPDSADARDRALLAAHVAGDREAFGTLVSVHQDRLWAVAVRTLGDREEAADALQDALLSAYRSASSYRGEARVTTWLHRIVVNACLDRVRRRQARPTLPLGEHDDVAAAGNALADRETALELEAALADLPLEQRVAIVLVDVQGYGIDEAARVLGCPPGTVKSRCFRGRARLAARLGHLRNSPARPAVPPAVPHEAATDEREEDRA
jgi:RNA polymerase sigma-70 factor (ECF subfamily)